MQKINAQAYLEQAASIILKDIIKPVADPSQYRQPKTSITVSFMYRTNKAIGQCFKTSSSKDGKTNHILIKPTFNDKNTSEVLGLLLHELIHACDGPEGCENGHRRFFRTTALACGLTGKMTATTETPELIERLNTLIIAKLGDFPFKGIIEGARTIKKQSTRMLKVECGCGFIFRTSNKWAETLDHNSPCPSCHDNDLTIV